MFQWACPGLLANLESRLMVYERSGLVATCNHISEHNASQYGTSFMFKISSLDFGESSRDRTSPGGRVVE